ncbi:MAG: type II toxin-antitoxin system HicB family antitoxin [Actinomycetota bacterium]
MATYRVVMDRDETGAWNATVPSVRGCHTYGRSIRQATKRIREALALFVDGADRADLEVDVQLDAGFRPLVKEAQRTRAAAEAANAEWSAAAMSSARALAEAGLSRRDVGYLLGVSHQRVQQLIDGSIREGR